MITFRNLKFKDKGMLPEELKNKDIPDVQATVKFKNGYGASVIRGPYSYGGREGLYELAVFDSDGKIDYSTPVTNDVCGHLKPRDVTRLLKRIQALPKVKK
jgi:hypothetical protein